VFTNKTKIIDAHGHLLTGPQDLDRIAECGIFEQIWLLGLPEELKIAQCLVATAREMLEVAGRYPGLFLPFAYLDFRRPAEQVDRMVEQGFVGFKVIYPPLPYDHESYFPYYERIAAYRLPVVFHTGIVTSPPLSERPVGLSYHPANMAPGTLYNLASAFPDLTAIAAHFSFPWSYELLPAVDRTPNLYVDVSGGMRSRYQQLMKENIDSAVSLRGGQSGTLADKIIFGIDACYGANYHQDIIDSVTDWNGFWNDVKHCSWSSKIPAIVRDNAAGIIKWAKEGNIQ
jgi:predicted TIM-barrel fold metal-dependent hydrolase